MYLKIAFRLILPFGLGLMLLLIGGAAIGDALRELISNTVVSSNMRYALVEYGFPVGMILFLLSLMVMSKLQSCRKSQDFIYLGKGKFYRDEICIKGSLFGFTLLDVRGLSVIVFTSDYNN